MRTKHLFLLIATSILCSHHLYANPAMPGLKRHIVLNNGRQIEALVQGDEHFNYFVDPRDGRKFVADKNNVCHEVSLTELKTLNQELTVAFANTSSRAPMRAPSGGFFAEGQTVGQKHVLVIPVQFSDVKFTLCSKSELTDVFSTKGYTGSKASGSVRDYYFEQSKGLFDPIFDVADFVTLSKPAAYYGKNKPGRTNDDDLINEFVKSAITLANASVDYSRYDWDGDGVADHICLMYAGVGEAEGGVPDETIWAHKGDVSSLGIGMMDGVTFSDYMCFSEARLSGKTPIFAGIGTFCHEFGHCLGLPDLYDTSYGGGYGLSMYDVMSSGNHNDQGKTPAGMSGFDRMMLGWQFPVELTASTSVSNIKPLNQAGGNFYLIRNDGHYDEYYLLENRQNVGFDKAIVGHGMLIYHVDADVAALNRGSINSMENPHEYYKLILADNDPTVSSDYYEYLDDHQGDFYPYKTNNQLTNTSTPAATLYYKNADGTYTLNKEVTQITQNSDGTMSFKFTDLMSSGVDYKLVGNGFKADLLSSKTMEVSAEIQNPSRAYSGPVTLRVYGINGSVRTLVVEKQTKVSIASSATYALKETIHNLPNAGYKQFEVLVQYNASSTKERTLGNAIVEADSYNLMTFSANLSLDKASGNYGAGETIIVNGGSFWNSGNRPLTYAIGVKLTYANDASRVQFVPYTHGVLLEGYQYDKIKIQTNNIAGTGEYWLEPAYYDDVDDEIVVMKAGAGVTTKKVKINLTSSANSLFVVKPMKVASSLNERKVRVAATIKATKAYTNQEITAYVFENGSAKNSSKVTATLAANVEKELVFDFDASAYSKGNSYVVQVYIYNSGWVTLGGNANRSFSLKDNFGDVDNDGDVDKADKTMLTEYLLDPTWNMPNMLEGDLNADGSINVGDIVKLTKIVP